MEKVTASVEISWESKQLDDTFRSCRPDVAQSSGRSVLWIVACALAPSLPGCVLARPNSYITDGNCFDPG